MCHEILSIISVTLLKYGWHFTGLINMLHHPCTLQAVNIRIWVSIQFYVLLCVWYFLVDVCPFFLSLSWNCSCKCIGTNTNVTTMWGIALEDILLVSILKHIGESDILYSRICTRVFIHLGLKFTSDREDFLVEMCILLSLVVFGPCGRGEKVGNKWNNESSETILWAKTNPGTLVWLVIESNNFGYVILRH